MADGQMRDSLVRHMAGVQRRQVVLLNGSERPLIIEAIVNDRGGPDVTVRAIDVIMV